MRVCLFLINLILSTFILNANNIKNSFLPTLEGEKKELSCTITFKENTLSGFCIIKKENNKYIGTIINEFGIKSFDFKYDLKRKKTKLLNVIDFIDKWYVKRIIKKDLNFLFSNKQANSNKNREIIYNESHIILTNKRYNIRYSLKPFIK